jgi:hypothetical protein
VSDSSTKQFASSEGELRYCCEDTVRWTMYVRRRPMIAPMLPQDIPSNPIEHRYVLLRPVGRNKRSALRRSISNTLAQAVFCRDLACPILRK